MYQHGAWNMIFLFTFLDEFSSISTLVLIIIIRIMRVNSPYELGPWRIY